jgi:anti-sigma B factor antagonist
MNLMNDVTVLELVGEALDCRAAPDVKAQLSRRLESGTDVIVDLSAVDFVDSAGLGVLLAIYKRASSRGRRVVLAGARPYVAGVMKTLKLDQVFESFPEVRSALLELAPGEVAGNVGR